MRERTSQLKVADLIARLQEFDGDDVVVLDHDIDNSYLHIDNRPQATLMET